jgi:hypothetical protein
MNEYEMFQKASGFELNSYDLDRLRLYVSIGDEREILELIEDMCLDYPEPEDAEVGFVVLYHFLNKIKN